MILPCSAGRIQRLLASPELAWRRSVTGAPRSSSGGATMINRRCWTMWTESRSSEYRAIGETSATATAATPPM